jgi:hypothetical protein
MNDAKERLTKRLADQLAVRCNSHQKPIERIENATELCVEFQTSLSLRLTNNPVFLPDVVFSAVPKVHLDGTDIPPLRDDAPKHKGNV